MLRTNEKKKNLLLVILVLIGILLLVGCGSSGDSDNDYPNAGDFAPPKQETWLVPKGLGDYIDTGTANVVREPKVAIDNSGDVIIVWTEYNNSSGYYVVYKKEYRAGVWSDPTRVGGNLGKIASGHDIGEVALAMSKVNSKAVIAWVSAEDYSIYKVEYSNGKWSEPIKGASVSPQGFMVKSSPKIAMSKSGVYELIAWTMEDGTSVDKVYKAEVYNNAWHYPSVNDSLSYWGSNAKDIDVAIDDSDAATIVWVQDTQIIEIDNYSSGFGSWTNYIDGVLNPKEGFSAADPKVVMRSNTITGDTIVVWSQEDSTHNRYIYRAEYKDNTWKKPIIDQHVGLPGGNASHPSIAMNNGYDVMITWTQNDENSIRFTEYAYNKIEDEYNWTDWMANSIDPVSDKDHTGMDISKVAMDVEGNVVVIWTGDIGQSHDTRIYKSERIDGNWNKPGINDYILDDDDGYDLSVGYNIAMNDKGDAIMVWIHSDNNINQQEHLYMAQNRKF